MGKLELIELLATMSNYIFFAIIVNIVLAIMFAGVIASGYSKHGAIRYFIAGVILPAFTVFVAQNL